MEVPERIEGYSDGSKRLPRKLLQFKNAVTACPG